MIKENYCPHCGRRRRRLALLMAVPWLIAGAAVFALIAKMRAAPEPPDVIPFEAAPDFIPASPQPPPGFIPETTRGTAPQQGRRQ